MNTHFGNWCTTALIGQRNRALRGVKVLSLTTTVAVFLFASPFVVQATMKSSLAGGPPPQRLTLHAGSKFGDPPDGPITPSSIGSNGPITPSSIGSNGPITPSSTGSKGNDTYPQITQVVDAPLDPKDIARGYMEDESGLKFPIRTGKDGKPYVVELRTAFYLTTPITNKDTGTIKIGDWITVNNGTDDVKKQQLFAVTILTLPDTKTKLGTAMIFMPLDPEDVEGAKLKGQIVNVQFP